jgi:hypothetical protein
MRGGKTTWAAPPGDTIQEGRIGADRRRNPAGLLTIPSFQRKLESSSAVAGAMSAAGPQRSLG